MSRYKVKSRQLTTWNTKACLPCFPYGSSPWPPIGSTLMIEVPSLALSLELIFQHDYGLASIMILLQIIITISMILILTTNPGILPQIVQKYETDEDLFAIPSKAVSQEHRFIITQHNLAHQQKYCQECQIYRPIRAIHCAACNHCVQRYDHHCPWLSVCIGKYNYKYFLTYLSNLVFLIIFAFLCSLSYTIINMKDQKKYVEDYITYLLVTIVSAIFILPIGRLLVYHIYLIRKGITTNEDLKKIYMIIDNQLPYQKLQCGIYREKRLPKFSYRNRIKMPKIKKVQNFELEITDSHNSSRTHSPLKSQRQSVFSSLIQSQGA